VRIRVAVAVAVGVGVTLRTGVAVAVAVAVRVGTPVGVTVGVAVAVRVGVAVGVTVLVGGGRDECALLPESVIFCGLRLASSPIDTDPLSDDVTLVGAKVTLRTHVALAASVPMHWPAGTLNWPLTVIAEMSMGAVLPFFSDTGKLDDELTSTVGNFSEVGLMVSTGRTALPFKDTVSGLDIPAIATDSVPESLPALAGSKPTVTVQ